MSHVAYDDHSITRAIDPTLSTHSLTSQERTALIRSDRKAGQILGVTLTRDVKAHGMQDHGVGRAPLAVLQPHRMPQADSFVDALQNIRLGSLMAAVGAKRARSREFSAVTLVGAFKDFGARMRLDKMTRKKRCVGGMLERCVAPEDAPVDRNTVSGGSKTSFNDTDTDSDTTSTQSFLEFEDGAYVITPTYANFPDSSFEIDPSNVYDDDDDEVTETFVWDVINPFAEPKNQDAYQLLQEHFTNLRLGESIGPFDESTTPTPFAPFLGSAPTPPPSRRSSCVSAFASEDMQKYLAGSNPFGYLAAFDAAEAEERARRKQKRDTLRSRLKKLAILGDEARAAVDGELGQ